MKSAGSAVAPRPAYNLAARFDAFPGSLEVLARWNPTDIADRTVLCHWHVQLSDPLYREFTSNVLAARWHRPEPTIDRTSTVRWVEQKTEGRWSSATSQRMAVGPLATAAEAGLCEKDYLDRPTANPDGMTCKVSQTGGRPILFLPARTRVPSLPTGEHEISIDGAK